MKKIVLTIGIVWMVTQTLQAKEIRTAQLF